MEKIDYIYREVKKFFGLWERPFIKFCEKHFKKGKNLTAIEVGTHKGENAQAFLHFLPISKLILVDIDTSKIKRLVANDPRVVILKSPSNDNSLYDVLPKVVDFVYIDADHSYTECKKDIEFYYPLIKKNGVLGGHDFCPYFMGVVQAVNEFSKKNNYIVQGNLEKEWWIIKK